MAAAAATARQRDELCLAAETEEGKWKKDTAVSDCQLLLVFATSPSCVSHA
jgi:hypothetical protein